MTFTLMWLNETESVTADKGLSLSYWTETKKHMAPVATGGFYVARLQRHGQSEA